MSKFTRRTLLKLGVVAGTTTVGRANLHSSSPQTASPGDGLFAAPPIETVRIGFVGIGRQGGGHVSNLLKIPGCRITAVCDIRAERTDWASRRSPRPAIRRRPSTTEGPRDFERLCETEDLDLVYNATPWEWHVPIMLAAMKNGKHAATEVPAAMTVDDCWAMVEAAEKYRKHCVMMENCNYDRMEMMVFNMVRQGLFGEILHAEGGYLHDLRGSSSRIATKGCGVAPGRTKLNGNLYPTHGLGPIANCLDINRGDRFDYLVSMSGPSRGLQDWAAEHLPADAPEAQGEVRARRRQHQPDQDRDAAGPSWCSTARTCRARTAASTSCRARRVCSRAIRIALYIEGRGTRDQWVNASRLLARVRASAVEGDRGAGGRRRPRRHGLHRGLPADQVPARGPADRHERLRRRRAERRRRAQRAVGRAARAAPVDVPDFTRGRWQTTPPLGIVHM